MSSVCPFVTLVDCDHIGWNSSKIISRLVTLGCSLSADLNIRGLLQGVHHELWAQSDPPPVNLSVGDIPSQIAKGIGFSGSADRMALFRVISNPRWRPAAILENFEWPYLRSPLHVKNLRFYGRVFRAPILYSTHRAVIFAIAQLSCYCIQLTAKHHNIT